MIFYSFTKRTTWKMLLEDTHILIFEPPMHCIKSPLDIPQSLLGKRRTTTAQLFIVLNTNSERMQRPGDPTSGLSRVSIYNNVFRSLPAFLWPQIASGILWMAFLALYRGCIFWPCYKKRNLRPRSIKFLTNLLTSLPRFPFTHRRKGFFKA